jgi:hypothetical protein
MRTYEPRSPGRLTSDRGFGYSVSRVDAMLELPADTETYLATIEGRRKAHVFVTTRLFPIVDDTVAICHMEGSKVLGKAFVKVTFVETMPGCHGESIVVISYEMRASTGRMKKVQIPNEE